MIKYHRAILLLPIAVVSFVTSCKSIKSDSTSGALSLEVEGITSDYVIPPNTFPFSHGSTIVEYKPRHFMTCFFEGDKEADRSVEIACLRKKPGESKWGDGFYAVNKGEKADGAAVANKSVGNPVLFKDTQGVLWLFFESIPMGGHSGALVDYKTSTDDGKTWSRSRRLVGNPLVLGLGYLPRNKPKQLSSGRVAIPLYNEFMTAKSFMRLASLEDGNIREFKDFSIPGEEQLQPSFVEIKTEGQSRLIAYMRNKKHGPVLRTEFDWAKQAWSIPEGINLNNPDSALDTVETPNNQILMAYNPELQGRTPLSLAISDDGKTFRKIYDFEAAPDKSYSYPALIRDSAGNYHVTYTYELKTIKHVQFTQAWLDQQIQRAASAP